MFEFVYDNVPPATLEVEKAEISLFARVPPYNDRLSLYVEISAKPQQVVASDAPDEPFDLEPRFYTEWLEIPLSALKGKGFDLLDGYSMTYRFETEQEDGFDQHPGAVYQSSHAAFEEARMTLTHLSGPNYRVQAEGKTEFGWTFRIDTLARIVQVATKSGADHGDKAPSPEVEEWFDRLYDRTAFPPAWSRKGSDEFNWYVFEAAPAPQ